MLQILSRADLQALQVQAVNQKQSIINWTYYDRQTILASNPTASYSFFKESFNGAVTLETTNMELSGQLQQQYAFVITEIKFVPIPGGTLGVLANATDQEAVTATGHVQLFIGNRPFYQNKLRTFIGGGLYVGGTGISTVASVLASPKAIDNGGKLSYMPLVDGQTSFYVQLDYDTAPTVAANLLLYAKMDGFLIRPNLA